jgi:hypothetical protein
MNKINIMQQISFFFHIIHVFSNGICYFYDNFFFITNIIDAFLQKLDFK